MTVRDLIELSEQNQDKEVKMEGCCGRIENTISRVGLFGKYVELSWSVGKDDEMDSPSSDRG